MKLHGRLHRFWGHMAEGYAASALLPLWRPYCWAKGHEDDSYGRCAICLKDLT